MSIKKAIAFTGPSGSGKTTLIERIAQILVKNRKVAIVKHDPSDKAIFDTKGKDSDRFYNTGANVAVVSPTRTTMRLHHSSSISDLSTMFGDFDLMMVEGLKTLPLPRLGIFRNKIDTDYLPVLQAIAIDDSIDIDDYNLPNNISILDLNDANAIIGWIDTNSLEI